MLDRKFGKRYTISQSSTIKFSLIVKVIKMNDPNNYVGASMKKEWNGTWKHNSML